VVPGFSPLDERLDLLPNWSFTPQLIAGIVRLGAHVPFAQVPALLAHFTGVTVSAATVRRLTEAAGARQVEVETAAVARIERELPVPSPGPPVQHLSVDGVFVPLVGGDWGEVKLLCLGTVCPTLTAATAAATAPSAEPCARTLDLSYFARLTDSDTFGRLATVETQRRGTETAGTVVAVVDGAAWCQTFIDVQRPDAVRILDFPHAVGYLAAVAHAIEHASNVAARTWLTQQTEALRAGDVPAILTELERLLAVTDAGEARELVRVAHGYLAARRAQLRYPDFRAAGYPIASGCVESANKLVVEARLKGSGMHWARAHVNAMLALRTVSCNQRWDEDWPPMWQHWRTQARTPSGPRRTPAPAPTSTSASTPVPAPATASMASSPATTRTKTIVNGKPTRDHPWRRSSPIAAKI
jgi:hypothetical protein